MTHHFIRKDRQSFSCAPKLLFGTLKFSGGSNLTGGRLTVDRLLVRSFIIFLALMLVEMIPNNTYKYFIFQAPCFIIKSCCYFSLEILIWQLPDLLDPLWCPWEIYMHTQKYHCKYVEKYTKLHVWLGSIFIIQSHIDTKLTAVILFIIFTNYN